MNQFLFYLAAFALVLGVLIVVHEFGHYLVARWVGVKVLCFSVGFGKPLWSRRFGRDGTEWAIGAFPLGGYVRMLDEREGDVAPQEVHRSFNRQSVWRRMAIVAAGPAANFLLAILIYWGLFYQGAEELRPILGAPVAASAAYKAGFENGEVVRSVGGESVRTWQEMRWVLLRKAVNQDRVEIEVINDRNEISVRRLDVSPARESGWQGDALNNLGINPVRIRMPAVIGKVAPGSPAERDGLESGDTILEIDAKAMAYWSDVVRTVRDAPARSLNVLVLRQGKQRLIRVATDSTTDEQGRLIGRIGASVREAGLVRKDLMVIVRYGPWDALIKAVDETWDKSVFSLVMIGKMITGEVSWRNISGPVTIADYAGQSARMGVDYYLKFLALVSISLAVLNLLPVPVLDGGHLLYYLVELIRRKPLSERVAELGQKAGMVLLVLLMAFAFYNDVNRLING